MPTYEELFCFDVKMGLGDEVTFPKSGRSRILKSRSCNITLHHNDTTVCVLTED